VNLIEIPAGHLAEVVTYLDMRERPKPAPLPSSPLRINRWQPVDLAKYRILFERVGAPWLWYSRLVMDDAALDAIINHPNTQFFAVEDPQGIEIGMIELDFCETDQCEIQFFGLVTELAGTGHGRWLMMQTLSLAWRPDVKRVHLHTCTLDHPNALAFYRKMGFVPRGRAVETFPDPRIAGILPRDAAPHVPVLDG